MRMVGCFCGPWAGGGGFSLLCGLLRGFFSVVYCLGFVCCLWFVLNALPFFFLGSLVCVVAVVGVRFLVSSCGCVISFSLICYLSSRCSGL